MIALYPIASQPIAAPLLPAVAVPVADFVGVPVAGSPPLSVQFTDLSTGSPTSWLWSFGDGNTSTAQNPSHVYASAGSYTVSLTATNASGGSDAKTVLNYITVGVVVVRGLLESTGTTGGYLLDTQFGPDAAQVLYPSSPLIQSSQALMVQTDRESGMIDRRRRQRVAALAVVLMGSDDPWEVLG